MREGRRDKRIEAPRNIEQVMVNSMSFAGKQRFLLEQASVERKPYQSMTKRTRGACVVALPITWILIPRLPELLGGLHQMAECYLTLES